MPHISRMFWPALAVALVLRMVFMTVMPLTDPSETRYGVLSANMARTGDFVVPNFTYKGVYRCFEGKPPLSFQMGGVACLLFGQNEFAVRLPSLVSALAILWLVFFTLKRLEDERTAFVGMFICATGGVFYLFSGLCMTDMVLTLCTTGAVCSYMLFAGCEGFAKKLYSVAFFAFLGLGMLAKGPVSLIMSGLPVFVFVWAGRRWGELARHAWVAGSLVFLAIALPWYLIMMSREPEFLRYFFLNENLMRFVTKDYGDKFGTGHNTFPGMALAWFALANLPWLPLAVWFAARRRGRGGAGLRAMIPMERPAPALAALGFLCITGFLCFTSRSLIQYLLPTAPLFAMWLAVMMRDWGVLESRGAARALKWAATLTCVAIIATMGFAMWRARTQSGKMPRYMYDEVRRIRSESPEYADAGFYFARNAPFSAEFYLGDVLRVHEEEMPDESVANSGDDFLLLSKMNLQYMSGMPQREVVYENRKWLVFAPQTKQ
ncbi:MAG: glycosyltransferase family 39 protein [Kiritimatiellaeota bacterium]|nr:glycosyltransferase family 39 protein [Kiritimatiellota bacterium]